MVVYGRVGTGCQYLRYCLQTGDVGLHLGFANNIIYTQTSAQHNYIIFLSLSLPISLLVRWYEANLQCMVGCSTKMAGIRFKLADTVSKRVQPYFWVWHCFAMHGDQQVLSVSTYVCTKFFGDVA